MVRWGSPSGRVRCGRVPLMSCPQCGAPASTVALPVIVIGSRHIWYEAVWAYLHAGPLTGAPTAWACHPCQLAGPLPLSATPRVC